MIGLDGADEAIARDVQPGDHLPEIARHFVRQRARLDPAVARGLDHLEAMLVRAGLEAHVAAHLALVARDRVGGDRLIGMADMRAAIGIVDRSGDVEGFGHGRALGGAKRIGNA